MPLKRGLMGMAASMHKFNYQHVYQLLKILSLAHEGLLLSNSYAAASIQQHLCNEGEMQIDFYQGVLRFVMDEMIAISTNQICKDETQESGLIMRYRTIDVRIWGDKKFRALSHLKPSGQGLFLYLLTNPNTNSIPGLYRAGVAAMAEELGWSTEGFAEAFDELIQNDLIKADLKSRVIFIPNAIKYNKPQSPNVIKSWVSHWDEIPECDLKAYAHDILYAFIQTLGKAFLEAFELAISKASRKIMPNQEQEQEQKQEQEHENINPAYNVDKNYVTTIFNYWSEKADHPKAKLDSKRKRVIENAFKLGFSLEQLMLAIDGCIKTPCLDAFGIAGS